MAFSELYVCDRCSSDAVLVHAEEWAPSRSGEPIPYPGYGPVGGLANRLWCPSCHAVRVYAFLTLRPAGDHPVVAYAEAQRLGLKGDETGPCPACAAPLTWAMEGLVCAACNEGAYRFTGEWEDAV